jgi:hypothetical protein
MNTNVLEGLRCPKCGYEDKFSIQAYVTVIVTDDGAVDDGGDHEWNDDSPCQCWGADCDFFGYVRDLRVCASEATRAKTHTPGPWFYNRDEGGIHGHVISTGDYIICDLPDPGEGAGLRTEANAQLIAVAPDLFKAAVLVIDRWSSGDLAGAVRMLDAAVADARGGRK